MAKKIHPSISMLPMADIAKYLNLVYGFRSKDDDSKDTINVAGVKSGLTAIAANDGENLTHDRQTIKNALELGGIEASKYLTKEGSTSLLTDTYAVSTISSEEAKNLRDELYQLKAELAKNGYIKNSNSYHGFQESFKKGETRYIDTVITRTVATENNARVNKLTLEDVSDLAENEYIIVANGSFSSGKEYVSRIKEINTNDNSITLYEDLDGPIFSKTEIKKTLGMYHEGMFIFAKADDNQPKVDPDKKKYIILNDDYNEIPLDPISTDKSGYIMDFRVPKRAPGVITKLSVQAAVSNNPGSLICHIAKINNEADEKRMHEASTMEEIMDLGIIIGTSKPVPFSKASKTHTEVEFDFDESIGVPIIAGNKYALLIVAANNGEVDNTENYWSLMGVRGNGENGDMHTGINLYRFDNHMGTTKKVGMDLWFGLTINETISKNIIHADKGLYSTQISLPINEKNDYATRARVELRINREGIFNISPNPNKLVVNAGEPVELIGASAREYTGSIFTTGTTIVIGDQISKVGETRKSNTYFSLGKTTYTPANADAYRVGYKVIVKASRKELDLTNSIKPIKTIIEPKVFELELVSVIPGKETNKEEYSSDRLIFEGSLKDKIIVNPGEETIEANIELEKYNDFEVQVYWENTGVSEKEMYMNQELAGKILDLTVSLDKCYTEKVLIPKENK